MGSNAAAALELSLRRSQPDADTPRPPPAAPAAPATPTAVDVDVDVDIDDEARTLIAAPQPEAGREAPAAPPRAHDAGASLPKPYLAGDLIAGKYRLTRIIGRGGMGAVWQAHNIPLDIDVAIKLIRRDRTAAGAAERLLTEARAAARLMHPAIVRVFDFGESEQGDPFIVMELLRGEPLGAILHRKKRLTPAVAVQTLLPVASALSSAHGKGIVHRDLKPDNIIVVSAENGALVPKIVDFGIAKLLSTDVDRQVTLAGEVLGSPDYMSPEQARGADNVSEATDIWAFSVVLYELVTGKRPFEGQNYNALIAAILTNDAAPITAHGVGDPALSAIIQQGLAKDVATRWPTMRDLGAALATWAVHNGVEDDVSGNPIAKQWLSGQLKRLLTVMPEGQPVVAPPPPPPGAAAAAPPPLMPQHQGPPPPVVETIIGQRRPAPRLLWIAPAIAIAGVLGTIGWFGRDRISQLVDDEPAVSAATAAVSAAVTTEPTASAAPTASASAEPAASASASASASAEPPASASATAPAVSVRAPWPRPPRKTRPPPAPKHIKF